MIRYAFRAVTSAVWAHSRVLGGAIGQFVWHHHCPPISYDYVQRAPRQPLSTPWEEAGAGTAWTDTKRMGGEEQGGGLHRPQISAADQHRQTFLYTASQLEAPCWDSPGIPSLGWTGSSIESGGLRGPKRPLADGLSVCRWRRGLSFAGAACGASLGTQDHLQEDRHKDHSVSPGSSHWSETLRREIHYGKFKG